MLHVHLYPWQCWLLVHALELLEDGSYRFRKVIVLVARQNGKTTLMGVLAAWWLFVDSNKHPDRVPPVKFLVVGAAQTLDNAKVLTIRSRSGAILSLRLMRKRIW